MISVSFLMEDGRSMFFDMSTNNSYESLDPVRYLQIEVQMKEEQRKVKTKSIPVSLDLLVFSVFFFW
jgi:hypothetical protein